jgi:ADP-ribose pyrophosphatase YjhB (NUDIX family)
MVTTFSGRPVVFLSFFLDSMLFLFGSKAFHLAEIRAHRSQLLLTTNILSASLSTTTTPIPRAAVSVAVRCMFMDQPYYLMVKRGKEPNKGMWSLPGGKLEFGESTVDGAVRELSEETKWSDATDWNNLRWYTTSVCTSDSIGRDYHYLIAQCFAETRSNRDNKLPQVSPDDDAANAEWFSLPNIQSKCDRKEATPGVLQVLQRMEELASHGLLPTAKRG